jgi:hypothetical protein
MYYWPSSTTTLPHFESCFELERWHMVPTQVIPPCSFPQGVSVQFPTCCVAMQTSDTTEPLLPAALKKGIKLYVYQMKDLCAVPRMHLIHGQIRSV